ncbi:MAG: TetR/AcrR family transcriptional regulator [Chitinophagaceae bacterium]|nr:TetR/AcrR family transcriptional regulator [Chitinophagaceae bacterium]MDP3667590.1 TetR/AcrR family transcriptional regulator [Sediminibacterium sp.]
MEPQERIVNKAHELFMRYGIRSVSMDDVATHLGISKKTIYQFYADKDALVEGVIDIEIKANQCECTLHKQKSENAIQELFMAVDMMLDVLSKINPTVLFDLEKYHTKAFRKHNEFMNKFLYSIIKENLDWGKSEGLYREEVKTDILARFRLASTFLILNPELFLVGKHSLPNVFAEITDNFLYGLASAKGLKLIQKYKQQRQKNIPL